MRKMLILARLVLKLRDLDQEYEGNVERGGNLAVLAERFLHGAY